ncbi:MAG: hypothetical protein JWP92_2969 [Caulobacter sp.]|nr:hypothetical protein [Caulobacter sp.]
MRKSIALTALAALIAAPLVMGPSDADASCRGRKIASTALGSGVGALLGNSISHGGGGAVIGAVGGGVVGHEIGRSGCSKERTYTRASRTRYAAAPAPRAAPRAVQKVYYDQYGNPVTYR